MLFEGCMLPKQFNIIQDSGRMYLFSESIQINFDPDSNIPDYWSHMQHASIAAT